MVRVRVRAIRVNPSSNSPNPYHKKVRSPGNEVVSVYLQKYYMSILTAGLRLDIKLESAAHFAKRQQKKANFHFLKCRDGRNFPEIK